MVGKDRLPLTCRFHLQKPPTPSLPDIGSSIGNKHLKHEPVGNSLRKTNISSLYCALLIVRGSCDVLEQELYPWVSDVGWWLTDRLKEISTL